MKIKKIVSVLVILLIFVFLTVDQLMMRFGTKKYYEVVEKKSIVKDSLTEGLIAYKGDAITFFKWNITSIKEIKK